MKKIILSLFILASFTTQAQTKKEKIKLLFTEMHQDSLMLKTIDATTASMVKQMSSIFKDSMFANTGMDYHKMMDKIMDKALQKSKENALKLLNEDMVDIYDKYFTTEEIEDFRNFYKSKSGQKMLNKMPDITKDIMLVMNSKYQTDLQQSLMKDIQEMTNQMINQK